MNCETIEASTSIWRDLRNHLPSHANPQAEVAAWERITALERGQFLLRPKIIDACRSFLGAFGPDLLCIFLDPRELEQSQFP